MLLSVEEQSLQAKRRKLEDKKTNKLRASLKRNLTVRRKAPSKLDPHNSEKLQCSLSVRSNRRRRKETLDVCQSIHGDAEGNYGSALKNLGNVNTCCLANVSFARLESSTLIVFCK